MGFRCGQESSQPATTESGSTGKLPVIPYLPCRQTVTLWPIVKQLQTIKGYLNKAKLILDKALENILILNNNKSNNSIERRCETYDLQKT